MYSTSCLFRLTKAICVGSIGFMAFLIAFGNITDYHTNYMFVEHVLKMDTTFNDKHIQYRSINNSFAFNAFYVLIILGEACMAFCCLKGSWLLFKNLKSSPQDFHAAKTGRLQE